MGIRGAFWRGEKDDKFVQCAEALCHNFTERAPELGKGKLSLESTTQKVHMDPHDGMGQSKGPRNVELGRGERRSKTRN